MHPPAPPGTHPPSPCLHLPALQLPPPAPAGVTSSPAFSKVSGAMARPSMWAGAAMGLTAGFMLAYQNSSGRLMGLKPNEAEVRAQLPPARSS